MLPIVAGTLVKPSTSSPAWKFAVIETVPLASVPLSGSLTVIEAVIAVGTFSVSVNSEPSIAASTGG